MPRHLVFQQRIRAVLRIIVCLVVALANGIAAPAQSPDPTVEDSPAIPAATIDPEQRAELYRTLQRHAEVLEAQSAVLKTVAKLVGPAVVHIEAEVPTTGSRTRSRRQQVEENGSGVIVELDGKYYVLTNWHLIKKSSPGQIRINLADGRQLHPSKTWGHQDTDIAVMAVSGPELVAARIGDSDRSEVGDFVLAVGSPFGLSQSVTFGIVSAKGRRDLQLGETKVSLQDFIQTDAAINPGNSGGPLINLRGEVIGINTAIASNSGMNEGIGFAIPVNMFMHFGRQLIEHGKVTRAFLGVVLDSRFGPAAAAKVGLPRLIGARISGITPGTPAAEADLRVGDVVLQLGDVPVEDDAHLIKLVGLTDVDTAVTLVVFRDRKPISVQVKVGDRAKFKPGR